MKSMNAAYVILKTLMWMLIVLFAGDFVMQTISYSFYKGDRRLEQVRIMFIFDSVSTKI